MKTIKVVSLTRDDVLAGFEYDDTEWEPQFPIVAAINSNTNSERFFLTLIAKDKVEPVKVLKTVIKEPTVGHKDTKVPAK